jgi:hypothetical protein
MIDQCFPKKTVTLSTRDPPWMFSTLKVLNKKNIKSKSMTKLSVAEELSERTSGIISHNRTKMAKSECIGTSQWWKTVDILSHRRNRPHIILDKEFK